MLAHAFLKILKKIKKEDIDFLFYQRKNEFFPAHQKNTFFKDLQIFNKKLQGEAYQFGKIHQHHCFLFHFTTNNMPEDEDCTVEILMYDSEFLQDTQPESIDRLRQGLARIFPDFEIQSHAFQPEGYSLNAVKGEDYFTIHITPEAGFFYISFEARIKNFPLEEMVNKLTYLFKVKSFDLIFFQPSVKDTCNYTHEDFFRSAYFHKNLSSGYKVSYMNFQKNKRYALDPRIL